jgi:predicted Fe-Mo cluster-binding NifX family protein
MKVVFPTDENMGKLSPRGAHFGRANFYTIVTLDDGQIKEVSAVKNPGHKTGQCTNAVQNIVGLGADALVVGGIGARPASEFVQAGVELYFDQNSPTVEESLERLMAGKLQKSSGQGTCSAH